MVSSTSVLVIDDSVHGRRVIAGQLEAAGYDVITACGDDAFAVVESAEPALIVLDLLMPSEKAEALCTRLRANGGVVADTLVLMLTSGDTVASAAIPPGVDATLVKPYRCDELLARIRSLLRQRRVTAEVRATAAHLEDRNRRMRMLEQLVVHDIKAPAQVILANAEMLGECGLTGVHQQALDDIVLAVRQVDRTLQDLLALSRSDDADVAPEWSRFHIRALADDVARMMRIGGRFNRVRIAVAVDIDEIDADRDMIRRVLENLVDNALKHAPTDSAITIGATREDDCVILRVDDEGPGVSPRDEQRIFERFAVLTQARGSHGLGLAFCRLVATAHGGEISVTPRSPRGSSFRLRLPALRNGPA